MCCDTSVNVMTWLLVQEMAQSSSLAVATALEHLPGFPRADLLPRPLCQDTDGSFVYELDAWSRATARSATTSSGSTKRPWPGRPHPDREQFCETHNLRLHFLSQVAQQYLLRQHRLRAFAADAGGGGDCFFLSVAVCLQLWHEQCVTFPPTLQALLADRPSRRVLAQRLRDIIGRAVLQWSPRRFVDFLTTCLMDELAGTWLDQWKMSQVIAGTCFAFMQTVNEVTTTTEDSRGHLVLQCKHGEEVGVVRHSILNGSDVLQSLQSVIARHVSEAGNKHWATHWDVDVLAKELKICFCIVGNEPVSAPVRGEDLPANCLHSYAAAVEDPAAYVCLYNVSHQHFQVLVLDVDSGFQSACLPAELPTSLADALRKLQS